MYILSRTFIVAILVSLTACGSQQLKPWHTESLNEEFTQEKAGEVQTFEDYLKLEDRLFKQLDSRIYAQSETGPAFVLDRYSTNSAADPRNKKPNWNRSFELTKENPKGAVLLLHGMSDSPYALRAIGKALHQQNYWVVGLRMPGHGTVPSGLRFISRHDMAAAVRLGMKHLVATVKDKPIHIIGYSAGAPLALEFTLDALDGKSEPVPGSLTLISPAIGIPPVAGFAGFKNWLSGMPGLSNLAYSQVQPEFDPYKYNSFATNAGSVIHRLTRSVAKRIRKRAKNQPDVILPPTLVFKSTVDATVTTDAVVDRLLNKLKPNRHELVLFDINRFAVVKSRFLIEDPAPFTDRVMNDANLPFTVTLITNTNQKSTTVISKRKDPYSVKISETNKLNLDWPPGVISLSHLALPIPPDDPLYGRRPPESDNFIFLGQMAIHGERGLLKVPADWMVRLRYNPFYDFLENHLIDWVNRTSSQKTVR